MLENKVHGAIWEGKGRERGRKRKGQRKQEYQVGRGNYSIQLSRVREKGLLRKGKESRVQDTQAMGECADRMWKSHGWGERGPPAGRL